MASTLAAPAPAGHPGPSPAPAPQAPPPVAPDIRPAPQPAFSVPANSGSWSLEVAPPGLGPVHVRLDLRGGSLDTRFLVGDPGAKSALEAGLPALRLNLAGQGVNVGSLNVGLSHGGGQGAGAGAGYGSPYGGGQGRAPAQIRLPASAPLPGRAPPAGGRSGLNLLG